MLAPKKTGNTSKDNPPKRDKRTHSDVAEGSVEGGKFGFRYRQQSMRNLDFATGNNQWEIWISSQATINGKSGFRYRNFSLIVACNEIQISH
jgi:hypothetical protein